METLVFEDVQGLVFSGYGKSMGYASYQVLRIEQPVKARDWIAATVERITHGKNRKTDWCLNLAFTHSGLETLGLQGDELESFEIAFQEGMASERRSLTLGDVGESRPEKWKWGAAGEHALLMIFACDEDTMAVRCAFERAAYEADGLTCVHSIDASPPSAAAMAGRFGREHFGFADGVSQPILRGSGKRGEDIVPAGEFILGYGNAYGGLTRTPRVSARSDSRQHLPAVEGGVAQRDFGRNGTLLVFRQLEQDVASFWKAIRNSARDVAEEELFAAKCVGRWPSGALVTEGARADPGTATESLFGFADSDPHGYGCPLGSHIRRSNPRDVGLGASAERSLQVAGRHRLLRRGRNYGPRLEHRYEHDDQERGLLFLCLNANIERQFEFVQHSWANNVKFGGLYDEVDPLIGTLPEGSEGVMSVPDRPVRQRLRGIGGHVTVRGGAYFFLPGIRALRYLGAHGQG